MMKPMEFKTDNHMHKILFSLSQIILLATVNVCLAAEPDCPNKRTIATKISECRETQFSELSEQITVVDRRSSDSFAAESTLGLDVIRESARSIPSKVVAECALPTEIDLCISESSEYKIYKLWVTPKQKAEFLKEQGSSKHVEFTTVFSACELLRQGCPAFKEPPFPPLPIR